MRVKTFKKAAHRAKLHLVPHPDNGHIPHILKKDSLAVLLSVTIAIFVCSSFGAHLLQNNAKITATVYPAVLVDLTNQDRAANNAPTLAISPVLQHAAQLKADDMATKSYFAHTSPTGITPWHWFEEAGYTYIYAGENLAVHFDDSDPVEQAWLASPTHRANILNSHYSEIGIATAQANFEGTPTTFVVEMFGLPAHSVRPSPAATPSKQVSSPTKPKAVTQKQKTTTLAALSKPTVAGAETTAASPIKITQESATHIEWQNTNQNIAPTIPNNPNDAQKQSTWYQRIVANPKKTVLPIYIFIVALLSIALTGMAVREHEKHHTKHVYYGIMLIAVIITLSYLGYTALIPSLI